MFSKRKNVVHEARKRSEQIIGTFTKMSEDLRSENALIEGESALRQEQIQVLNDEVNALQAIKLQNEKVATKLANFFAD